MNKHRSFAERYINALNELHSCEGSPDVELINELQQASALLEEYSLMHISSLCHLMNAASETDIVSPEDLASVAQVIDELAVLSHIAMETKGNTERMITRVAS